MLVNQRIRWVVGMLGMALCGMGMWGWFRTYDVVIDQGKVWLSHGKMANVGIGIRKGKIVEIGSGWMLGRHVIDAKGWVVLPGGIDVGGRHTSVNVALQDGVTTILSLVPGVAEPALVNRDPRVMIHVGVNMRACRPSANASMGEWAYQIGRRIESGGVAIYWDIPTDATVARSEMVMVLAVAKRHRVPLVVGVPLIRSMEQGVTLVNELGRASTASGVMIILSQWLHQSHIFHPQLRPLINQFPQLRWTFNPYTADTRLYDFDTYERLNHLGIRMVEYETGEVTWAPIAKAILFLTSQRQIQQAILDPKACMGRYAADGGHPAEVASYTRLIRRWVMDGNWVTWVEGIQCMSERPVKWWGGVIPSLLTKGRIAVGYDADLVMIDLDEIEDWATYQLPDMPNQGVKMVMRGGWVVWPPSPPN